MRDLVLTILIPCGLIWGLVSARGSTLVLLWIGFQRPHDFSYGVWNDKPLWQLALIICVFSNFLRGEFKPKHPPMLVLSIIFFLWMAITCITAFNPGNSWWFFSTYVLPMAVGLWVVSATINDLDMLKASMWIATGALAINGAKTGASLTLSGGGSITDEISGFVGDNNVFGLTLCLVVAVMMGLRATMPARLPLRVLFYAGMFFSILTIIFTQSRGALISVSAIMFMASLLGGKPIRHLALLTACATIIFLAVPKSSFERLDTLNDLSADESAMGRVENWILSLDAAQENPAFGIGLGNHIPYHAHHGADVQIRVAHSVYFQILGELSFMGLFLFLAIVAITWFSLWRNWRRYAALAAHHPEVKWVRNLFFWLLCGFTGYSLGAGLLDMLYIEYPWYMMLFIALLGPMISKDEKFAALLQTDGKPAPTAGRLRFRHPGPSQP
jgi:putative inorganic carbon (HCO3(-)) transporter